MKTIFKTFAFWFLLVQTGLFAQEFIYELDLTKNDDVFHVSLIPPRLTEKDNVYSFVSFAPGVHQVLDFGRFVRAFKVYDEKGGELLTQKISTNDWRILEPSKVRRIDYEIDDSFDMDIKDHPIYPMSGTGINENYTIINPHGVFGYFFNLKSVPVKLRIKYDPSDKLGTALEKDNAGFYRAASYYQLADSPILLGDMTVSSLKIGDIDVEAYVYSPNPIINADTVMALSRQVLESAYAFVGFAPVKRYAFLMYFSATEDAEKMPVLNYGGALEHSYSSTYALPAMPRFLPQLKDIIAHEFMHILTPLNLRSEVIANFDYSRPTSEDQHLWLYEGLTEWVAHIMQLRSGDITMEEYLDRMSNKINNAEGYSSDYSLTRLSAEWSTDAGNKQYGNIYQLGALTANALDIKLLQLSGGKRGLQDVYLQLIKKYGKDKPFDNKTFFNEIIAMTYPEIGEFIEKHIKGAEPLEYKSDFAALGINYIPKRAPARPGTVYGINIGVKEGELVITGFSGEYRDIGLKEGDVLEKLFDEKVTLANARSFFSRKDSMKAGDSYPITVRRAGKSMNITGKLFPKMDYHVFEVDDKASKKAKALREIWSKNR